ncbi:CU044_5270 family protein [Streptomyces sp. NPDC056479]|uniref:CU044_5270 family protein n=1 Tax=Streptomyces sp. NPDC056479 TaxID=3345832 RepID=UPI0036BD00D9
MADELELLRRANPVPVDGPHYGDGPLDHHAERHLNRLLHERPPAPRRRARLAWGLAATAVVATLVSALLLTGQTTAPAVAAPRPLIVQTDSRPVSLERLAERAEQASSAGSPALRKGTHVQSWSLAMSDQDPPVTLPQETIVRWNDDDSHTEIVVATDPRHPGRPVLTDEGGEPRLVDDGHVLSRRTYPRSWSDAPPESPPPHDAAALHDYLEEAERAFLSDHSRPLSTAELLDATKTLLDHWTLGPRESAALARLLADAEGLRPVGQVTDRLGRRGQAYVYKGDDSRRMLIMDPANGAVLGLEVTFTRDDPRFGVKAGEVMTYSAWMR